MAAEPKCRYSVAVLTCFALAGCQKPSSGPLELVTTNREMALATPVVGGPSRETPVEGEPVRLLEKVAAAMKDSGVRLVQRGSSADGKWLLGKSLADRSVLAEIRPVYPGRSTIKITVEGGDLLARELLNHLYSGIVDKTH